MAITTAAEQALSQVQKLSERLRRRAQDLQPRHEYYEGQQKLRFASDQFRTYYSKRYTDFADNWCAVVADSPTERLVFQGCRLPADEASGTTKADDDLWRVFAENGGEADSGLAFLDGIIAGRAFGLVWGNPDDETTPTLTFEDARECLVDYVPGSRRLRRAGIKVWSDGSTDYATLYLPDSVWKYQRAGAMQRNSDSDLYVPDAANLGAGKWLPRLVADEPWPLPNPMDVVPLVELANRPRLSGPPLSDLAGVMAMQDAVNLLWAQLFTASDFAALPQRVVLGADTPKMPIMNAQGEVVGSKNVDLAELREKRILWLPDEGAKIEEWTAASLDAYTGVLDVAIAHIAAQTRTPQHYLVGKMANLSADALKAAETGLVKKTQEKQLYYGEGLRELHRLIALAQGLEDKAKQIARATILWQDAEMRSVAQLVDGLVKLDQIGFPFEWIAEQYGLDPTEVARVVAMKKAEQADALFNPLPAPPAPQPVPQPPAG